MPRHINSAYRVHVILKRAASQEPANSGADAWARTFGITGTSGTERAFQIIRKLALLHAEVERASTAMSSTSYSEGLYAPAFANVRRAIDPLVLASTWSQHRQYLTPETLTALHFCSELLPHEEELLGPEDLKILWKLLYELRESVLDSGLPDELKTFVNEQIDIIEQALDEYEVVGSRVFREAIALGSLSYAEHADAVESSRDEPEVQAVAGLWGRIAKMTERTESIQKLLSSGFKVAKVIGEVAEAGGKML